MGRVHKKKIAEYTEAEENKSKEKGAEVDGEKDAGSESENEGNKDINDGATHDGDIATQTEDDEFKSLQGDTEVQAKNSSNGNGGTADAKKSHKRKGASNKASTKIKSTKPADATDELDSDDEPLNGAAIAGTSKKRKIPVPSTSTSSRKEKVSQKVSGKAGVRGNKREKVVAPGKKAPEYSEEEEYEVKEIIDHKIERGVSLFLIRWKGYGKDDDTWERESTLNCPELIQKFKKKQAPNESKSVKKITKPVKKARGKKDEEDKEWEVEKIMDFAEERSGRHFLIRWKGFSSKDDTWEPEENLSCSDIIDKFMKRVKTQENISVKELREEPKKTKRLVNETVRSFNNTMGRKSKRATTKKSVYYGDSDE